MYDSRLKYKWDNNNVMDFSVNEARAEGIRKGIEKGIGQGRLETAQQVAHEMKKEGQPYGQISKYTKLSIEEIEKL